MCKPVIIDDGGSLRIREMEDNVTMDGLISPPVPGSPVASNQNFFDIAKQRFVCTLTVSYLNEDGVFTTVPFVGGFYGLALAANDIVTITSDSGKTATVTFPALVTVPPTQNNTLSILLSESAAGLHEESRRRYIIPKFGKIVSVVASVSGAISIDSTVNRSYTAVHFSPGPPTDKVLKLVEQKEQDGGRNRR
jgi:hypothetical protein